MKPFNGYEAKRTSTREQLPIGGYIARILNAEEVTYSWGSVLLISFDVAEGAYKDFFKKDYEGQNSEDKKWRGTYRLNVPKDDGSEKDGWTKRTFGNAIWCIEDANPGYHWDWNESGLKGKTVGVLFRNEEWEYNGQTGWSTKCCAFAAVGDIRDGSFKMPKDKPLKNKAADSTPAIPDMKEETYNGSLPWD
jgi:hypothetical protein